MSLRDFLERFRPAGTPGASVTGVPADRTAERAAELESALAQLTDVQREAARIRAAADEAAEAVRQDAAQEAARIVAAAQERAPGVRRQAAEPFLREARREADALRAAGDRSAAAVRERAGRRMPDLVDRTVADALRLAGGRGGGEAS
ncbi:hypothetical protein [Streptomyces roseochromogenus]|uniref:Uncharacterized protein n=1 Tax=Streptomyces roseochromogenus subsp. oscitans DS 12.976 TaxID=1352936 RepID=V6KYW0_STRRC|nr:hypothetical protein [Streptomyces roseochromogenus]EST36641.1 hypothetical protein M878_01765 [Streptomyces roseochromogenus subsp. oscitans DS 12.976]